MALTESRPPLERARALPSPTRRDLGSMAAGFLLSGPANAAPLLTKLAAQPRQVTLSVPGTFRSIEQALASIAASGASSVTRYEIRVADGHYRLTGTIRLDLAAGASVQLIGNVAYPARCVLEWIVPRIDGIIVDKHMFGLIDGFTIRKPKNANWPDNATGVLALNGAFVRLGANIVIDNWYYGAAAREASTLLCSGISVHHAGDVGIWAYRNSTVFADGATSSDTGDPVNGWGYGFQAEFSSSLFARGALSRGCLKAGFAALSGSRAHLPACIAEFNQGSGFLAREAGEIDAEGAISRSNGGYGAEIDSVGEIRGVRLYQANRLGDVGRHL